MQVNRSPKLLASLRSSMGAGATLVALRASSTRSFFSLSSVSVCAPTCTHTRCMATLFWTV